MLTREEIDFWDKVIEKSGDLDLARKFYKKIGRQERLEEVLKNTVKTRTSCGFLLQYEFEKGVFKPELKDKEVKQIAAESLRKDINKGNLKNVFVKLEFPVYSEASVSGKEIRGLVNEVLKYGYQGYGPGENPRDFAKGLVEFPVMHEFPQEIDFAYAIFDNEKYQKYAEPELAKKIVTLKVFHYFILGSFEKASEIKNKHLEHYDNSLAYEFAEDFLSKSAFYDRNYPLEYLVRVQRTEFKGLFPENIGESIKEKSQKFDDFIEKNKDKIPENSNLEQAKENFLKGYKRLAFAREIVDFLDGKKEATLEIDDAVSEFKNEDLKREYRERKGISYKGKGEKEQNIEQLNKAFDTAEDMFGIIRGIVLLNKLLDNEKYVKNVGEQEIKEVLNQRTSTAMQEGKSHVVYALRYGTCLDDNPEGPIPVSSFKNYVDVDKSRLLEQMISDLDRDEEYLFSDKCNFRDDNLTIMGTEKVDETYNLYKDIQNESGRLPSEKDIENLILLKTAMHIKEWNRARGMKIAREIYEDSSNSPYIDKNKFKRLLNKVFDEYFGNSICDGFKNHALVSYFYELVSSDLGELVKDDRRLESYFKLHNFLESD
jgi:hypothetical protein